AFIDQVNDELHFMQAFKVCHLRRISSFNQRFEASLDQRAYAAAKYSLLAEQVCFCFFLKGCFKYAGTCTADPLRICKTDRLRIASSVLCDCDEPWNAEAFNICATYEMSWRFRSDEQNVCVCRCHDLSKVNVEAVGEHKCCTLLHVR